MAPVRLIAPSLLNQLDSETFFLSILSLWSEGQVREAAQHAGGLLKELLGASGTTTR